MMNPGLLVLLLMISISTNAFAVTSWLGIAPSLRYTSVAFDETTLAKGYGQTALSGKISAQLALGKSFTVSGFYQTNLSELSATHPDAQAKLSVMGGRLGYSPGWFGESWRLTLQGGTQTMQMTSGDSTIGFSNLMIPHVGITLARATASGGGALFAYGRFGVIHSSAQQNQTTLGGGFTITSGGVPTSIVAEYMLMQYIPAEARVIQLRTLSFGIEINL